MTIDDSRRLTGPNLYLDGAGAIMDVHGEDVAFDSALEFWSQHIKALLEAVGWGESKIAVRCFSYGASLAFEGPIDALYAATEINEAAWEAAWGTATAGIAPDPLAKLSDLKKLIAEERNPGLIALEKAAEEHGLTFLWDDDEASIGLGTGSKTWPVDQLPSPDDVDWSAHHDIPVALPKDAFPIVSDWQSVYTTYGTIRGAYKALKISHQGVDVAAPIGTPALAVADGVVMLSGRSRIAGQRIALEHGRASAREGGEGVLISEYIHLKRRLVFGGERVRRGQIIGTLGITGHGAAGHVPHLHYATSLVAGRARRRVNPHQYWYAGPGRVRLFSPRAHFADDALRHTYPLPCRRTLKAMLGLLDALP